MSKSDRFPPLAAPETDADRRELARRLSPITKAAILELLVPLGYVSAALYVVIALYQLAAAL